MAGKGITRTQCLQKKRLGVRLVQNKRIGLLQLGLVPHPRTATEVEPRLWIPGFGQNRSDKRPSEHEPRPPENGKAKSGEAMTAKPRVVAEYLMSGGTVTAALILRFFLDGVWGDEVPYGTFYLAVVAVIWFTRTGPAILAIAASLLLGDYFFTAPRHTIGFTSTAEWLNALFFVLVSSGVLVFANRERTALLRERSWKRTLEDQTEALRASEDKFRRIYETANEGIWVLDGDARITMVNNRMAEMLGCAPDELVGRSKMDIIREEDLGLVKQLFDRRRAGLADQLDVRLQHKEGHVLWVLMCARPIYDAQGQFSGALDMFTDITERKQAEIRVDLLAETAAQLLRSREPQHVVNALCQKVMACLDCQVFFNFLVDEKTAKLRLNACGGISEKEAQDLEWLDFGTAVCGCAARDGARIVAEDVQHSCDVRTDLVRAMGVQAYACHPLKVQERVLGTLSFGTRTRISFSDDELSLMKAVADLVAIAMERKRAQLELQHNNQELERRVEERTKSLQELTEQLNAFCYTVAHDLRAPLRTQLSFARMLLIDYGDKLGDTGKDWAGRVVQAAERQSNIIQDLMAHINVSRADMPTGPICLAAAVEQAAADLKLELAQKDASIICCGLHEYQVLANPSCLHLVALNLLTNAVKFVAPRVKPEVRIWTELRDKYVRLCVQDNGIGIKPEDYKRLFGAFQRLHRNSDYPGTGLGLAIVKKAAERMGGSVGVESELGRGSRFWVDLPLAPAS